jgi:DNA-binding transcriptional MerR regulator/methylmalonyl-CoA mutase cobalamin-binding subunit
MSQKRHPIQVAALRAGLSPELLRAWEKRYQAVAPERTGGGQRIYSDEDVQRLRLLRLATAAGRRIGSIASLSSEELSALVDEDRTQLARQRAANAAPRAARDVARELDAVVQSALQAGFALDEGGLHEVLDRQLLLLRPEDLIVGVIAPLMRRVGELWHEEHLRPAHEHLISGAVRGLLARLITSSQLSDSKFHLVVSTPSGQRHEFGAMMAATVASLCQWRVTYLGADLPLEDVAAAVIETKAQALALSLVYPVADPELREELLKLETLLPSQVAIIAGGAAAESYRDVWDQIGARVPTDLLELKHTLVAIESEGS